MPPRKTLEEIVRQPGGTKPRDLVRALQGAGWSLERHGGNHDVWTRGSAQVYLPRHTDGVGTGTMRQIAKDALLAEEEHPNGG
ncbi:MAG: type II toxin-antitoxin system HicA family toxin [Chloroflexi bacterium]|nr:type II toxin-antitoxin system HicA family toxin [Chloroflexota bacterium]MDA1147739.1 type II toxin-antitoxin system HicA family toxin [Chloroflexota bacterium]